MLSNVLKVSDVAGKASLKFLLDLFATQVEGQATDRDEV